MNLGSLYAEQWAYEPVPLNNPLRPNTGQSTEASTPGQSLQNCLYAIVLVVPCGNDSAVVVPGQANKPIQTPLPGSGLQGYLLQFGILSDVEFLGLERHFDAAYAGLNEVSIQK